MLNIHVKRKKRLLYAKLLIPHGPTNNKSLCARITLPFPIQTNKSEVGNTHGSNILWANPGLRGQGAVNPTRSATADGRRRSRKKWNLTRSRRGVIRGEREIRKRRLQLPKLQQPIEEEGEGEGEQEAAAAAAGGRRKKISANSKGWLEENRRGEEKLRRDRNRVWSASLYIPELQAGGFSNGSKAQIMRGETKKAIRRPQKKR